MPMLKKNVFLKILDGSIPATIVHEDEHCIAFRDLKPQAPVHVLIIPRKEIRTHDDIAPEDAALIGHMHLAANAVARQLKLDDGYRLIINCKDIGGQTVPHLHMHMLAGRELGWPPG
jgi:histidine triad (HIT) family protein